MHADTVAVLAEPPIKAKLDQLGVIADRLDAGGARPRISRPRWTSGRPVIKAANIKVNE